MLLSRPSVKIEEEYFKFLGRRKSKREKRLQQFIVLITIIAWWTKKIHRKGDIDRWI
jgi:hypothetical protein